MPKHRSPLLRSKTALLALTAGTALLFGGQAEAQSEASSSEAKRFPEETPENQALSAATPYLGNEDFTLRNDYWKGIVTTEKGTALRLQFFKGNTYRIFFGASTKVLPSTARLHLHLFDAKEKEVASVSGEPGEAAVVLNVEKARKTGLYLVLMRIEPREGPSTEVEVPSVLFYGWE